MSYVICVQCQMSNVKCQMSIRLKFVGAYLRSSSGHFLLCRLLNFLRMLELQDFCNRNPAYCCSINPSNLNSDHLSGWSGSQSWANCTRGRHYVRATASKNGPSTASFVYKDTHPNLPTVIVTPFHHAYLITWGSFKYSDVAERKVSPTVRFRMPCLFF